MLAGLLPIFSANAAYLVNIGSGFEGCIPYWEGCTSVSRGVRSGAGLVLFKAMALPSAAAMAYCWYLAGHWLENAYPGGKARKNTLVWMGITGAVFYLVYANWLGTEGEIYRWLRRYGVVFYFGLTGLAQLFLVSVFWKRRRQLHDGCVHREICGFCTVVILSWMLGVASAFKRKLIDDTAFFDRVENALEWNFSLTLSLAFVALGLVFRADRFSS